jgi:starch synthase
MKGGVVFADKVSTVSPTYAREIQTPDLGFGLEGVFANRAADLAGILNGVDYGVWDPRHDAWIARPYGPDDLAGKAECKSKLQDEMGLAANAEGPLLGMISRLVEQKGIDLVVAAADRIAASGAQLALLGSGDPRYEAALRDIALRHPGRIAVRLDFDEGLAHRIEAGADIYLMPSRFEPAGLNQLYSLRYGTVPVVRRTGGLADTVVDADDASLRRGTATGFVFDSFDVDAMWGALARTLSLFENRSLWRSMMLAGMRADFSWARSAAAYASLYETIVRSRQI